MKRRISFLIIVLIGIIGLCYAKPVYAFYIPAPQITGISYLNESSIRLNYNSNSINNNYKIQIFNSTLGKNYTAEVNTKYYDITNLTFGKTYNFMMRVYYRTSTYTYVSSWSNIMSATPKAVAPSINSITAGDGKLTLNYKAIGKPKGVQIYLYNNKKEYKTTSLSNYTFTGLTNGSTYKFIIRNYYDNNIYGPWSSAGSGVPKKAISKKPAPSNPVSQIDKKVNGMKTYSSLKTLKTFSTSNSKKVWSHRTCSGCSSSYFITQSFAYLGNSKYAVSFITRGNSARIAKYNSNSYQGKTGSTTSLGHCNGMTYNPNTGYLYSINIGYTSKVSIYKASNLKKVGTKNTKYNNSNFAYDSHTNRYYGGTAKKIRVYDRNFKYKKTIYKKRNGTGQDGTGYHGVAFSVTMEGNYIDMYRISDGKYLGGFKTKFGELESLAVDETGHLLLLIYGSGNDNKIYRTNYALPF